MSLQKLRKINIEITKQKLKKVNKETVIIKTLKLVEELERTIKSLKFRIQELQEATKRKDSSMDKEIKKIETFKKRSEKKLTKIMRELAPCLTKTATPKLGAKLISAAGSLKKIAFAPSSKIQVFGAEKALFKHLKTGSKSPKHGIIFHHESVQKSEDKGKAARQLAAKISLAAKKDYFQQKRK